MSSTKDETDADFPVSSKWSAGSSTNQTETCGSCSDNGHGSSCDSFIQQLFFICDQDGDGFISSTDLLKVLDDMGLEEVVDVNQILDEMGGNKDGRISYNQFVQCLISVRGDIEQVQVFNQSDDCIPDNDSNLQSLAFQQPHCSDAESQGYSTFGTNSHSYCSGEIDSGARDCSPERYTNTKQEEQHTDCDVLLNFANKLHMAALVSLRKEVQLLQSKLRQSDIEIRRLNEILIITENENAKITTQLEDSLESQALHYEERITELHSILAEVHKKSVSLRDRDNLIIEEEEEDDDESPDNSLASKKVEVFKNESGGSLISESVTSRQERPLMEDVLIKQAHVSKVVPRMNKPPPPPRAPATKTAAQKSLELELEHVKSSQKNVSALNDVLCQNLEESRTQCEKFFTLLLKYESVVGTQQLVIDASYKLCDAYEYLVKLLDVKNSLASSSLLAPSDGIQSCSNCRLNSVQSCSSEGSSDSKPGDKELFSRLNGSADSRFLEKKLRLLISKLDEERKSYDGLVDVPEIPVESLADESKFGTTACTENHKRQDVEMQVLIQEMMNLKEERAELRCRLFEFERKEESRVVPKYFPGLTPCLQELIEADQKNPESNLEVKISQLSKLIRSSALAYQSKEDELNQTISKMKHMLKFLLQLVGRQKRDSHFELQTLEELLHKCPL